MLPNHRDDNRLDELRNQHSYSEECPVLCRDKSGKDGFYRKLQEIPTRNFPHYMVKQCCLHNSSQSGDQSKELYEWLRGHAELTSHQ